jgi:N-acetyl-anhydromuramyl-L-alanine amidase AmpD
VTESRTVRTRARVNVRGGAPSTAAPIVDVKPAGSTIPVSGFTAAGETIDGNPFWYVDVRGRYLWAGATDLPRPSPEPGLVDVTSALTTDGMETMPMTGPGGTAPAIDRLRFALPPSQYCVESTRKDLLVLHFTAGSSASSAVNSWLANPSRVATAYVVDVDGTIYETFPPSNWAWHLGVTDQAHERRSIGIEIANVGPLEPDAHDPAQLNWWPREWREPYCRRDEAGRYVEQLYRGKRYFAAFPDRQVEAVGGLARHLCERFDIPKVIPLAAGRLDADPAAFAGFRGIATHANFRADKWDVCPAFDWARLGV